ncbi:hypothetical protein C8F01DRAFT_1377271, partial [Mycena amicta]
MPCSAILQPASLPPFNTPLSPYAPRSGICRLLHEYPPSSISDRHAAHRLPLVQKRLKWRGGKGASALEAAVMRKGAEICLPERMSRSTDAGLSTGTDYMGEHIIAIARAARPEGVCFPVVYGRSHQPQRPIMLALPSALPSSHLPTSLPCHLLPGSLPPAPAPKQTAPVSRTLDGGHGGTPGRCRLSSHMSRARATYGSGGSGFLDVHQRHLSRYPSLSFMYTYAAIYCQKFKSIA